MKNPSDLLIRGFLGLIVFWTCSSYANPTNIDLGKIESSVEFLTIGNPGFLKIRGKGGALSGNIDVSKKDKTLTLSGTFKVQLEKFNTGIKLRNNHMKEKYLEVKKYPTADLEVKDLSISIKEGKTSSYSGKISIHGVTKPVEGKLVSNIEGPIISFTSTFKIKISDFRINTPNFLGVSAADEVTIDVKASLNLEDIK